MIDIREANSKQEKKKFMMIPFDIYKGSPYWVSPLLLDMRHMFGIHTKFDALLGAKGKHPFYEYGTMQLYIAYKNGNVVGRIAAIQNDTKAIVIKSLITSNLSVA